MKICRCNFRSNNFFEVGIGFKTVHIAGHDLLAEGIVNLSIQKQRVMVEHECRMIQGCGEYKFSGHEVVFCNHKHTSSGIRPAL